ncbi:MAG TPA: ABC transporter ATP-binding protein [Gemmatimonadaceae bacterium]
MPILSVRGVSKSFARGLARSAPRSLALAQIDLDVSRGEVIGLFGPEASGKTTLLQCIAGLLRPDAGDIELHGLPINMGRRGRVIAYAPAVPVFYPFLTPRDVISFECARLTRQASSSEIDNLLGIVELSHRSHFPVRELSRDEIKQVAVAESLCGHPDVLLIDTMATERVDERVIARVAARGPAVIIAVRDCSHIASVATRLIHLDGGRVERSFTPEPQLMFVAERLH